MLIGIAIFLVAIMVLVHYKELLAISVLIAILCLTQNILASVILAIVVYILFYFIDKNDSEEEE